MMRNLLLGLFLRFYAPSFREEYAREWWEIARRSPLMTVFVDTLRNAPGSWRAGASIPHATRKRGVSILEAVLQDARFGFRTLRRRPLFSLLAITTLGIGIGSATAMFSVVEGVLLRPLPYQEPEELVAVWETFPEWREHPQLSDGWDRVYLAWPEFQRWREHQSVFDGVAVYGFTVKNLGGDRETERIQVGRASSSLLGVLGVRPFLGRGFARGEDGPDGETVALLSHARWVEDFGSDDDVVGRTIQLDDQSFTVVGVLPPGFRLRGLGRFPATGDPDLWIPLGSAGARLGSGSHGWEAIARLKDGFTAAQALPETESLLRGDRSPDELGVRILSRIDEEARGLRAPLFLLLAGSLTLLLIAIVNVAILMAGEVASRSHEMATRVAVGARIPRLLKQLLAESLILGLAGSALGVLTAHLGTRSLLASAPAFPRLDEVGVNPVVLLFALGGGIFAAVLFGTAPSRDLGKGHGHGVLRSGGRAWSRSQLRTQRVLVTLQIALTVVLLTSGGLLARSLGKLFAVEPGFDVEDLSMVHVSLPPYRYPESGDRVNQLNRIRDALAAIPGVQSVSGTTSLPFHGFQSLLSFGIEGLPDPEGGDRHTSHRNVLPDFFETMGIPILEGRPISELDREDAPTAAIISETLANAYWPGESPLGARILFGDTLTVVGVAADVLHESLDATPLPVLYGSFLQRPEATVSFVVRSTANAELLLPAFREAVRAVDSEIPAPSTAALSSLRRNTTREERFRTTLLLVFAASATLLSVTGVFGITARMVTRRAREMAIRKAMGAELWGLLKVAVSGTASAGVSGIALGLAGALAIGRLLEGFLFGISSWDPLTLIGVGLGLLALCLAASLIPARRAGSVAPMEILREE